MRTMWICAGLALAFVAGCHFPPGPPRRTREQVRRDNALAAYHKASGSLSSMKDVRYISYKGFFNTFANYAVAYVDRDNQLFIDDDWKLDNWGCDTSHTNICGSLSPKKGRAYRGVRFVDRDADGTAEKEWDYFFDLKLTNKKDSSEIWVSTYDLPREARETLLDVFLNNYADSIGGTELQMGGDPRGYGTVKERKFVTRVVDKKEISLGRYEAIQGDVVISDIDKLKLEEDHVHARLRVVIARVDCDKTLMTYDKKTPRGIVRTSGKALMVIGYYNSPDYFDSNLGAFEEFLKRFVFKRAETDEGAPAGEESSDTGPAKKSSVLPENAV